MCLSGARGFRSVNTETAVLAASVAASIVGFAQHPPIHPAGWVVPVVLVGYAVALIALTLNIRPEGEGEASR
jgi:hypothetical protein